MIEILPQSTATCLAVHFSDKVTGAGNPAVHGCTPGTLENWQSGKHGG